MAELVHEDRRRGDPINVPGDGHQCACNGGVRESNHVNLGAAQPCVLRAAITRVGLLVVYVSGAAALRVFEITSGAVDLRVAVAARLIEVHSSK